MTAKRNRKLDDYMHKASRKIVKDCVERDIRTIIIGYNKDWKREAGLGRKVNQSFVGIPTKRLIEMIQYKAQEAGIHVILRILYIRNKLFGQGRTSEKKLQ